MPDPLVTVEEVRGALPHGVYLDFHDNPPTYRPLTPTGPFGRALIAEGRADLSPTQIAAAINERCEVCVDGVAPKGEANDPGATRYTCPTCNGTGSAAPELLELVRGRS